MTGPAYIFDTELTDRENGEIISAAWIRLKRGKDLISECDDIDRSLTVEEMFSAFYKPSRPSKFGALAVHHILPHHLEKQPPSSEFSLPTDGGYIIGHSIDTDWAAAGSPANFRRIDTHGISEHLWQDDTDGFSVVALIYLLEGAIDSTRQTVRALSHTAYGDVRLELVLLKHILKAKPEIRTWGQLWEFSEQCRCPVFAPWRNRRGVKLVNLETSYIRWALSIDLDPYLRRGLEKILEGRGLSIEEQFGDEYD